MSIGRVLGTAAAALVVASAGAASPTAAAVLVATYKGKVATGTDMTGIFGVPGGSLAGRPYTARYTYDTAVGVRETTPTYDRLRGGDLSGLPSPVSASLTIGGFTFAFAGQYDGYVQTSAMFDYIQHGVYDLHVDGPVDYSDNRMEHFAPLPGATLVDAPVPPTLVDVDGFAAIYTYHNGYTVYTNMFLDGPATLSVAGVPEPASWAVMILGFAAVGAACRRRARTLRPHPLAG